MSLGSADRSAHTRCRPAASLLQLVNVSHSCSACPFSLFAALSPSRRSAPQPHPHCDYVLSIDPTRRADRFPRRSCYSLLAPCRCSLCPMLTISVATHLLVSAALLSRRSLCAFAHDTRRSLQTPLANPVARFCLYAYSFSRPPLCLLTTTLSLILCSTHYPPS